MNNELNQHLEVLEIDLQNWNTHNQQQTQVNIIKKQYYKLALKWHPDKHPDKELSKIKFQNINSSYTYLMQYIHNLEEPILEDIENNKYKIYTHFLEIFISSIISPKYKQIALDIIIEILNNCNKISNQVFDKLEIDTVIQIYNLLFKYKDIFNITDEILDFVSSIIQNKYNNTDNLVYILTPTLQDLWNDNIYKLYVEEHLYLVPLWHTELYFENKSVNKLNDDLNDDLNNELDNNSEIIVLCNPKLPINISIDEDNNIIYQKNITYTELCELIQHNKNIICEINDNYMFEIPTHLLYMKQEQIYKFFSQGISRIIEDDIYNVSCKSDVIVKINII
jgi:hypothetical protein